MDVCLLEGIVTNMTKIISAMMVVALVAKRTQQVVQDTEITTAKVYESPTYHHFLTDYVQVSPPIRTKLRST